MPTRVILIISGHCNDLLIVCDYYRKCIEFARLNSDTTPSVLRKFLSMFARFVLPDVLVTNNESQFASAMFAVFAKQKAITHVTSSPHYEQTNGISENAVMTLKLRFAKAKQSGESKYMALLDWRNQPSEGMSTSPTQRVMGGRCKRCSQPRYDTDADTRALTDRKRRQSFHYNQHTRPLKPIDEGATVRIRLPVTIRGHQERVPRRVNSRNYRV